MSGFLANVGRVLQGTIIAQAIGILALPVITRLFPPESFGNLQFFATTLSLALIAATLRYDVAVLQAEQERDAEALVRLCFIITLICSLSIAVGCAVLLRYWGPWSAGTTLVMWLLAPGVFIGGVLQTLGYLPLRCKDFRIGARAKIVQSLAYVGLALLVGSFAPSAWGLLGSDLLARAAAVAVFVVWCAKRGIVLHRRLAKGALKGVAWVHRAMPKYATPGCVINTAGGVMTPIMMYTWYDAATLGQYALVERSLMMPVGMVAIAVSQVFSADLSEQLRLRTWTASRSFRQVVFNMARIGALPALVVGLSAPWFFPTLFGSNWTTAGELARLLAPLMFASFVTGPVNMAITLCGRQKTQMVWEVCRLLAMLAAWATVVWLNLDFYTAITLHVVSGVSMSVLYLVMADRVLNDKTLSGPNAPLFNPES